MTAEKVHLIGFGSQGSVWAQCLKTSDWHVDVYLPRESKSHQKATDLGFQSFALEEIKNRISSQPSVSPPWVVMTCPDLEISNIYEEYLTHLDVPLRLVLAHGYAVYSGALKTLNPNHQPFLLAPKAIGPKLLQNFQKCFPLPHSLVAAVSTPSADALPDLVRLAQSLGFQQDLLIETSFEKEAVGDLISEQGLLCGGVFNLLDFTVQAMIEAEIPEALIREECVTELELIAGLIREKGPKEAFGCISQAAQAGTIAMRERFLSSGFLAEFSEQMNTIKTRKFVEYLRAKDWKTSAQGLTEQLSRIEPKNE